jgi:hypothetical protein
MGILNGLDHVINGLAPALFLALTMPLLARVAQGLGRWGLWRQIGVQALALSLVLLVGFVWLGGDGRMLTYAALVLASASLQAWMSRR